ncbi:MAG TPA: 50S ribosomal protein L24 [Planctomycetota bacterium]|nr:50S ribosomal protein L24 [Planctomycetota bacterium]
MKIRRNDIVKVISGDGAARGQTGKVIRIMDNDRVLVQGVNMVWKHMRRSQQHPHGARIEKEASVHISNLMLVCPSCSKATKVKMGKSEGGDKDRLCKKCKAVIPSVTV